MQNGTGARETCVRGAITTNPPMHEHVTLISGYTRWYSTPKISVANLAQFNLLASIAAFGRRRRDTSRLKRQNIPQNMDVLHYRICWRSNGVVAISCAIKALECRWNLGIIHRHSMQPNATWCEILWKIRVHINTKYSEWHLLFCSKLYLTPRCQNSLQSTDELCYTHRRGGIHQRKEADT